MFMSPQILISAIAGRTIVRSLLIVMLSGCAAKNVEKEFAFKDGLGADGLVVFSVSHDLRGGKGAKGIFYIDSGAASGKGWMVVSLSEAFPGIAARSEFKDSYGQLIALALPAGKHQVDGWKIIDGYGGQALAREKPPPLEFQVHAGQAKYLGNLHAGLRGRKQLLGVTMVDYGYTEVRDQRDRDVGIFEARYPQFKGKVLIELLPLGTWVDESTRGR